MRGRVLVVVASRGRPHRLTRMIASVRTSSPLADIAVYLDDDNRDTYPTTFAPNINIVVGPRMGPVGSLNELVRRFPGYEAYGAATDDCTFDPTGWDRWILDRVSKFRAGIGVLCPHMPGAYRPMNFPWASAAWIDAVGYFAYPRLYHNYWDVCLEILGEQTQMAISGELDFVVHHEAEEALDGNTHLAEDARQFSIWCAYHRKPLLTRLKALIA